MSTVLVPRDLLAGLERAPVRCQRLLVTAWVLGTGDFAKRYRDALMMWPANELERPGRPTVLSILLELEQLGVVTGVGEEGEYFTVAAAGLQEGAIA